MTSFQNCGDLCHYFLPNPCVSFFPNSVKPIKEPSIIVPQTDRCKMNFGCIVINVGQMTDVYTAETAASRGTELSTKVKRKLQVCLTEPKLDKMTLTDSLGIPWEGVVIWVQFFQIVHLSSSVWKLAASATTGSGCRRLSGKEYGQYSYRVHRRMAY
jgi:hypothetical protein